MLPPNRNPEDVPTASAAAKKKKNPLFEIAVTIIIPALVLSKLSAPERLGPTNALLVAVALPLAWGVYGLVQTKKLEFMPILGVVSVLLTGGLGLVQAGGIWFAVKEAAIPAVLGAAVLATSFRPRPLVRMFLLNDAIIDLPRLEQALHEKGSIVTFERLLRRANALLACTFFLSAALNFGLAVWVLKSPSGTPEFNAELARMSVLSYPVIMLPCLVAMGGLLYWIGASIHKLTGIPFQELLKQ